MPSVDEIWGYRVRNLNGDVVRVDQVVTATESRVADLQRQLDDVRRELDQLRNSQD
jgi:hypothetical protein